MSVEPISLDQSAVSTLRANFDGIFLLPGEPGYDEARHLWNGMIDRYPAAIARCAGPTDVATAITFSRTHSLPITIKSGGHGVAGKAVCDNGLMIDCSLMDSLEVDPVRKIAKAGGGVTWGPFDVETQKHGLAATGGVVLSTGIAGLTLGGGIGFLMRKCGLSCDNLIGADVVLADGSLIATSETENADLLWALRGGGGNFGVVTSLTYRLHEIGPIVLGGVISHPLADAKGVAELYRKVTSTAPDELTTYLGFGAAADGQKAVHLIVCYCGDPEAGEAIIRPLREYGNPIVDSVSVRPYLEIQSMFADTYPHGRLNYWKSGFMSELSDAAIDTLIETYASAPSPVLGFNIEHLGGAISRIASTATAFGERSAPYNLIATGCWIDPAETEQNVRWIRESWAALTPETLSSVYINYVDDGDEARTESAYGGNYARLAELKAKYDPDNVFRHNHNIAPAKG